MQKLCPQCHLPVTDASYFCPNCGKSLKKAPLSTSSGRQIYIYLLSFFLPPYGLVPGIKYLFQESTKAKIIGTVALLLTFISIAIAIIVIAGYVSFLNKEINAPLSNFQGLGL